MVRKLKPKEPKNGAGRPRKEIDMKLVASLCEIQCTGEEIAAVLGMSYDTLERRVQEETGNNFADYRKDKTANGRMSLRRAQFKAAMEGNVTMQIWLGKQTLGQRDKADVEHSGTVGVTIVDDIKDE